MTRTTWTVLAVFVSGALLSTTAVLADGIDFDYGRNLPHATIGGRAYKELTRATLLPGFELTKTNVVFEGNNALCQLVVDGFGPGDLDLFVYDANTGALIGSDQLLDNVPVVTWRNQFRGPVNIVIRNVGTGSCGLTLYGNW